MRSTLDSMLPWWIAGPALGLVLVGLLGLASKRFGVLGGVTDLVIGPSRCCSRSPTRAPAATARTRPAPS